MLKEVEVPQPLDLGIVNLVLARSLGMGKAATRHEIDMDGQPPLPGIEVHRLHEPRRGDAQRCRNYWLVITPSHRRLVNPSSQDGRAAASTVVVVSLWICGRRAHTAQKGLPAARRPQLHRLNNNNKAVYQ